MLFKVNRYTLGSCGWRGRGGGEEGSSGAELIHIWGNIVIFIASPMGSTLQETNLLRHEQILSLKNRPPFGVQRSKQEVSKSVSLCTKWLESMNMYLYTLI